MKTRIKQLIISLAIVSGAVSLPYVAQPASAIDVFSGACGSTSGTGTTGTTGTGTGNKGLGNTGTTGAASSSGGGSSDVCGAAKTDDAAQITRNIINTILFVLGFIAVIMIIIGGIRYTTSNGEASQIKAAKDTVLYAVVGLVVAIMSFAIVNFVITNIK